MHEVYRCELLARYIIDNKTTIRKTASKFEISKSLVHNDVSNILPKVNRELYFKVKKILNKNFEEKHIRGGIATRNKYLNFKTNRNKKWFFIGKYFFSKIFSDQLIQNSIIFYKIRNYYFKTLTKKGGCDIKL